MAQAPSGTSSPCEGIIQTGTSSPVPPRTPMPLRRRLFVWFAVGLASACMVVLNDVNRLIGDVPLAGATSYDSSVFTSFKLHPLNTEELSKAVVLWEGADSNYDVKHLLQVHLLTDMGYVVAYCSVLMILFEYLGAGVRKGPTAGLRLAARGVVVILGALDLWETLLTYRTLVHYNFSVQPWRLVLIQLLSTVKWCFVAIVVAMAFTAWLKPEYRNLRRLAHGYTRHPASVLAPLIVLVVLFVALVALPAGGPLDQLPDVIRYLLANESETAPWIGTVVGLLVLVLSIVAAGLASTDSTTKLAADKPMSSVPLVVGILFFTVIVWVCVRIKFHSWEGILFTLPGVIVVMAFLGWAVEGVKRYIERKDNFPPERFQFAGRERRARMWIGALAAIVVVSFGLGLVRATAPPIILDNPDAQGVWFAIGVVICALGGFFTQSAALIGSPKTNNDAASSSGPPKRGPFRRFWSRVGPASFLAIPVFALAITLMIHPESSRFYGTLGVVQVAFAFFAVVLGFLTWISRSCPLWAATLQFGFARTPWILTILLTWSVASYLNTEGRYHDARVGRTFATSGPRYANLEAAYSEWLHAQLPCRAQSNGSPEPLVLMAAPGGGIRAAYWTAATLDSLFKPPCARARLFAVSGVSGGSVGATAWLAATAQSKTAVQTVTAMSKDEALASAMAGLLLRDLFQPFIGVTSFSDRAALLEDGWTESAKDVFKPGGKELTWSELSKGESWVPVMVLNASSVTDGCRVLVSNVAGLPARGNNTCLAGSSDTDGTVSASIDALRETHGRADSTENSAENAPSSDDPCPEKVGFRAVTAALLSARFPIVSPTGALVRCVHLVEGGVSQPSDAHEIVKTVTAVTYAVDGGYFENTGLLSLIQIWRRIEPLVRAYNASEAGKAHPIVPWFLVADNRYRVAEREAQGSRPREVFAPVRAYLKRGSLVQTSPSALEQMARAALSEPKVTCTPQIDKNNNPYTACTPSPPDQNDVKIGRTVVSIAPVKTPSVAAPLGWVLSTLTRSDMDCQLYHRLSEATSNSELSEATSKRELGELLAELKYTSTPSSPTDSALARLKKCAGH